MIGAIIYDVDGVLLDWLTPFRKFCVDSGFTLAHDNEPEHYDMSDMLPGVPRHRISDLVREFNRSDGYSLLGEIAGAKEGVNMLMERFPDAQHIALTMTNSESWPICVRAAQIMSFGITDAHILAFNQSKSKYFRRYAKRHAGSDVLVIEDNPKFIIDAHESGCRPIVASYEYNKLLPGIPDPARAYSWGEIICCLNDLLEEERIVA